MKRGEVVLVYFPYSDRTLGKLRLALSAVAMQQVDSRLKTCLDLQ